MTGGGPGVLPAAVDGAGWLETLTLTSPFSPDAVDAILEPVMRPEELDELNSDSCGLQVWSVKLRSPESGAIPTSGICGNDDDAGGIKSPTRWCRSPSPPAMEP